MNAARVIVTVTAGVLPGAPEPQHSRQWVLSSQALDEADDQAGALAEVIGRGTGYATLLWLQPDRFNWVRLEWTLM